MPENPSTQLAGRSGTFSLTAWCVAAAAGTYFCMYAFRKPFTAGSFENVELWGLGYKTVLVISQVGGYMISKFIGIKIVSELPAHRRAVLLLVLIAIAEVAWLLFAITPMPYNWIWAVLNGLPLGMVFGLVLGFLEGRLNTEALAAGLCTSFIVADGVTRSVGGYLLKYGVSEVWMPFLAGVVFIAPLLGFVWMLTKIPPPTLADVQARSERTPMNSQDRWQFFRKYWLGLTLLVLVYLLVTILRSLRADFAPEIWRGLLGESATPSLFAWSEMLVGFLVILICGSVVFLRDNRRAFFTSLSIAATGTVLIVLSLLALDANSLSPLQFMVLLGLGLYLPYISVHTTIFERLIAMTRDRGNIGYLMYLADSFGYLGYVLVLLVRNLADKPENFFPFFLTISWVIGLACLVLLIPCWWYFARHPATQIQSTQEPIFQEAT